MMLIILCSLSHSRPHSLYFFLSFIHSTTQLKTLFLSYIPVDVVVYMFLPVANNDSLKSCTQIARILHTHFAQFILTFRSWYVSSVHCAAIHLLTLSHTYEIGVVRDSNDELFTPVFGIFTKILHSMCISRVSVHDSLSRKCMCVFYTPHDTTTHILPTPKNDHSEGQSFSQTKKNIFVCVCVLMRGIFTPADALHTNTHTVAWIWYSK